MEWCRALREKRRDGKDLNTRESRKGNGKSQIANRKSQIANRKSNDNIFENFHRKPLHSFLAILH